MLRSLRGQPEVNDDGVWQDREIKFDGSPELLKPREGEVIVDKMMSVEDTKGNNGVEGRLLATTLRLIWKKSNHVHTNLSIGYNCIVSVGPLPHPPHPAPPPPWPRAQPRPRLWHRPRSPCCGLHAPWIFVAPPASKASPAAS